MNIDIGKSIVCLIKLANDITPAAKHCYELTNCCKLGLSQYINKENIIWTSINITKPMVGCYPLTNLVFQINRYIN